MGNTYNLQLQAASAQYAYVSSPEINPTGAFTLECWFTLNAINVVGGQVLISKWDESTNGRGFYLYVNDNNNLVLHLSSDGSNDTASISDTVLSANTCYHVAVTHAANGTVKIYINSVLDHTDINYSSINSTNAYFRVGAIGPNASPTRLLTGTTDDVRFWDIVRTATEIANNYQRELAGNETLLDGYWKLNNNYIDSAKGYSLNPVGLPSFTTNVCFIDNTTTSTTTTSTSSSTSTTTTSTSTTTTSTSTTTTSTSSSTSSSTTTSTTTTRTTTSTTTTSTSTTSTSSSTTTTSTSTSTTTSTSTSTTMTIDLKIIVEKVK